MGVHYIVRPHERSFTGTPSPTLTPPPLRRGGDQRSPSPVRAFLRTGESGGGGPPEPPPIEPPATPFAEAVAAVVLVEANTESIAIGSHLSGVVPRVHVVVGQAVEAGDALSNLR